MADIQLQEESFKRAEKARLRNKIEERKLKHELDRKHGMRESHEYRLQMMSEEQRVLEKELDKIKTEIRKPPLQDASSHAEDVSGKPAVDKEEGPGRVRGRAMSINDQSSKFASPSTFPPSPSRRTSQVVAPSVEPSRRPSMAPYSSAQPPLSLQSSEAQHGSRKTHPRRQSNVPNQAQVTQPAVSRRTSKAGPWHQDGVVSRRTSKAGPWHQDGVVSRRTSKAGPWHQDGAVSRRTSKAGPWSQDDAVSRRASKAAPWLQESASQPSVNELLQMAMKNAVMYAIKHADKLNMHSDNTDDDDDDDDDDDEKSDEFETTSQYRRAFVVVTKESDSEDDEDEHDEALTMDAWSVMTRGTRLSETSKKSLYPDQLGEGFDTRSQHLLRPLSRTSTTLTSVSQISGVKKKQRDPITPRNTNSLQFSRMGASLSQDRSPRRTNYLPFMRETSSSASFTDVHSVVSEGAGLSSRRKNEKSRLRLPDISPRPAHRISRESGVPDDALSVSTSQTPRSLKSRRRDVSTTPLSSSRHSGEQQLPEMTSYARYNNN